MHHPKKGSYKYHLWRFHLTGETNNELEVYTNQISSITSLGKCIGTKKDVIISIFKGLYDATMVITIKIDGYDVNRFFGFKELDKLVVL